MSYIQVPKDYFMKMAKADYNDYLEALPREIYQNSIDAGAKRIVINFDEDLQTITIKDDGRGMTEDVLVNKLLAFGGSHKDSTEATGAFGKAKELIFFSWENYEIETGYLRVEGSANKYYLSNKDSFTKGTKIVLTISDFHDFERFPVKFKQVAKKIESKTEIFIDHEKVEPMLIRAKRAFKVLDWCKLYKSRDFAFTDRLQVRINGIWMYSLYIADVLDYNVIVEITKGSTEVFTSNRDSLKGSYKTQIDDIVKNLVVNTKAFTREEEWVHTLPNSSPFMLSDRLKELEIKKEDLNGEKESYDNKKKDFNLLISTMKETISDIKGFDGSEESFPFAVKYKKNKKKGSFTKAKENRTRRIIALWSDIVGKVILSTGQLVPFWVGATFDKDADPASLQKQARFPIFYLNIPMIPKKLPKKELIVWLYDMACHEAAHLKEDYHSERFIGIEAGFKRSSFPIMIQDLEDIFFDQVSDHIKKLKDREEN